MEHTASSFRQEWNPGPSGGLATGTRRVVMGDVVAGIRAVLGDREEAGPTGLSGSAGTEKRVMGQEEECGEGQLRPPPVPGCKRKPKAGRAEGGETPFTQPLSSTNCSHAVSHAWNPNPSCRLKAAASEDYLPLPPSQGGGLVKTESQGTPRKTHGGLSRPQKKTPHHSHPRQKRLRSRGVRCSATLGVHIPRCHRQTPEGHTRGARAPLWGREKRN